LSAELYTKDVHAEEALQAQVEKKWSAARRVKLKLSFSPSFSLGSEGIEYLRNRFNGFKCCRVGNSLRDKPLKQFCIIRIVAKPKLKLGENKNMTEKIFIEGILMATLLCNWWRPASRAELRERLPKPERR
jgi:hypothetical protein